MPINETHTAHVREQDDRYHHQRILGTPPGWALRWGITVLALITCIFLTMAWFIQYPDTVKVSVTIVTEAPPVRVVAPQSGKVVQLFVKNKDTVQAGQQLLLLESAANWTDVQSLQQAIKVLTDHLQKEDFNLPPWPGHLKLGVMQPTYANLSQAIADYRFQWSRMGITNQVQSLNEQVDYLQQLNNSISQQTITLIEEVQIATNQLDRVQSLQKQGVHSDIDVETAQTNYLQSRRQLESLQSKILENKLQIAQYQAQIITLKQQRQQTLRQRQLSIQRATTNLQSELIQWKQNYLITAPTNGQVSLSQLQSTKQFVRSNEAIATIVPHTKNGQVVGRALLPVLNAGKVTVGQVAHIRLEGFPYQEFGILKGQIESISLVPEQDQYLMMLSMPDPLVTTYKKHIPFSQEMPGTGFVMTKKRRVLVRVFEKFWSMVKN